MRQRLPHVPMRKPLRTWLISRYFSPFLALPYKSFCIFGPAITGSWRLVPVCRPKNQPSLKSFKVEMLRIPLSPSTGPDAAIGSDLLHPSRKVE